MSVSLTTANKRVLQALLATGRWANESEIVRYGLYLVAEQARKSDYAPLSRARLAKAYRQRTAKEKAEDDAWEAASVKVSKAARDEEP